MNASQVTFLNKNKIFAKLNMLKSVIILFNSCFKEINTVAGKKTFHLPTYLVLKSRIGRGETNIVKPVIRGHLWDTEKVAL